MNLKWLLITTLSYHNQSFHTLVQTNVITHNCSFKCLCYIIVWITCFPLHGKNSSKSNLNTAKQVFRRKLDCCDFRTSSLKVKWNSNVNIGPLGMSFQWVLVNSWIWTQRAIDYWLIRNSIVDMGPIGMWFDWIVMCDNYHHGLSRSS